MLGLTEEAPVRLSSVIMMFVSLVDYATNHAGSVTTVSMPSDLPCAGVY